MQQAVTAYMDVYALFEVYAFAESQYQQVLEKYGELSGMTRKVKQLLDVTQAEISARGQWGRYHLYQNNPTLFAKHRLHFV